MSASDEELGPGQAANQDRGEDLDALDDPEQLAEALGARLDRALALEAELAALTEQLADLEVAEIAERAPPADGVADTPGSATEQAAIGAAIRRQASLETRLDSLLGRGEKPEVEALRRRLDEAIASLRDWLDAPAVKTSKVPEKAARVVLLVATLLACWGAYAVHPAVLVLLIPVAAPLSMLLNRGDDTRWRRLGAERRFARTGFDPPVWDRATVEARLAHCAAERANLPEAAPAPDPDVDADADQADREFGELSMELVEVEQLLKAKLRQLALAAEQLTPAMRADFLAAAEASTRRSAYREATAQRTRVRREVGDLRDAVWRTLRKRGVEGVDTRAGDEALREALARLPGRRKLRLVHASPDQEDDPGRHAEPDQT